MIISGRKGCDGMFARETRMEFELFKSEACHWLKNLGDVEFVTRLVTEDWISIFWNKEWYPECFYLLAMLDYLSAIYNVPKLGKYNDYRGYKLESILYPRDILFWEKILPEAQYKKRVLEECRSNPCSAEFLKYNIIEGDIRDVK